MSALLPLRRFCARHAVARGSRLLAGVLLACMAVTPAMAEDPPAAGGAPGTAAPGSSEGTPPATNADGTPAAAPAAADTAPPPPLRNPPLRLEVPRNRTLAAQLEPMRGAEGNIEWLGKQEDPFLGLYLQSYAGQARGAILVVHDNEQHPDWPGVLHELRTTFPRHGWSTLSIALPDYLPIPPVLPPLPKPQLPAAAPDAGKSEGEEGKATPEEKDGKAGADGAEKAADKSDDAQKTDADSKSKDGKKTAAGKAEGAAGDKEAGPGGKEGAPGDKDGAPGEKMDGGGEVEGAATPAPAPPKPQEFLQSASEIAPDKFPATVDERLKTATRYLLDKGNKHIVVVAFGTNAGLVAHLSRTMLISELDGVVLIDPRPWPAREFDLATDVADLRIPVLDVVPELEPGSNPLLRKQSTGRAETPGYEMRQVRGAAANFSGYEPYVFKTVRGWVDTRLPAKAEGPKGKPAQPAQPSTPTANPATAQPPAQDAPPAGTPGNIPPSAPAPGNKPAPDLREAIPPPIPG